MGSKSISILQKLVRFLSVPIIAILLIFTARRLFFSLAILLPSRREHGEKVIPQADFSWPDILILVPCRDEEHMLAGLCQALERLEYPLESYQIVLIDDGSTDTTRAWMEYFSQGKPGWHVFSLARNTGKAGAMNAALKQYAFGEIIYVFDADHRPEPDALKNSARYFEDPLVAGVSGFTIPANSDGRPSAYYSIVENHVHQMITMRAKDRLQLAPALLGSNCGYRRKLLMACGGFRDGALLEDSDLTLVFYRAGYRVRFAQDAIAKHQVPETVRGYLNQHTRWARGFMDVASQHGLGLLRDRRLSLPVRIELLLFSLGYLDRMAIIGAAALSVSSLVSGRIYRFPWQVLSLALLTPLVQIVILFIEQRMPGTMWVRLPLIPVFYALDIYAAGIGMMNSLTRRAGTWTKTMRSQTDRVVDGY